MSTLIKGADVRTIKDGIRVQKSILAERVLGLPRSR